jgi:hypothetical protein
MHAIHNIKPTLTYFDNSVISPADYIYIYIYIYIYVCMCVCVFFIESWWLSRGQRTSSKAKVEVGPSSITLDVTTISFGCYVDEYFLSSG